MNGSRYFLVTNDAARCALEIWCHAGNLPPSIVVVDNPDHMLKIPNGAQVRCFWYGTRDFIAAWESWWTIRRLKGGFDFISCEDWDTICDWAERARKAPALRLLLGEDRAEEICQSIRVETATVGLPAAIPVAEEVIPAAAIIDQPTNQDKRGPKWT